MVLMKIINTNIWLCTYICMQIHFIITIRLQGAISAHNMQQTAKATGRQHAIWDTYIYAKKINEPCLGVCTVVKLRENWEIFIRKGLAGAEKRCLLLTSRWNRINIYNVEYSFISIGTFNRLRITKKNTHACFLKRFNGVYKNLRVQRRTAKWVS